jgi:hypothetical protein
MATVSVVIPTHRRPQLLPRAIESAFAAGTDVEVVVVDDASTDETATVCRAFKNITYVRLDENHGVAGARNAGVLASSGEYIALLDDDDVRLPGTLDLQLARLRETPQAALIYAQALFSSGTDRNGRDRYPQHCPSGDLFWQLLAQNFIPSGSVVFRRSCLSSTGMFEPSIAGIDDWDLWIRLAALYPVIALEQPVVTWRRPSPGSDQTSAHAVEMVSLATRQFREHWLKLPRAIDAPSGLRENASRQFSQNMASHLVWEAGRSLSCGQLLRAHGCLLAALRLHAKGLGSRLWREISPLRKRAPQPGGVRAHVEVADRSSAPV